MIIACPACATRYVVPDSAIGADGRVVRCAKCRHSWHQDGALPDLAAPASAAETPAPSPAPPPAPPPAATPQTGASRPAIAEDPAEPQAAPPDPLAKPGFSSVASSDPAPPASPPPSPPVAAPPVAAPPVSAPEPAASDGGWDDQVDWDDASDEEAAAEPDVAGPAPEPAPVVPPEAEDSEAAGEEDAPPPPPPPTLVEARAETANQPDVGGAFGYADGYDDGASPFDYEPPFRQRRNPLKLWTAAGAVFALIALGTIGAVSYFGLPDWVPVSRPTFGLQQPDLVLDFPADRQDRRELPNGSEFFGASGTVTNVGRETRSVPSILIVMRDARDRIVYSWEVAPPQSTLAPGESMTINEAVTNVPRAAKFAEIGWKPG